MEPYATDVELTPDKERKLKDLWYTTPILTEFSGKCSTFGIRATKDDINLFNDKHLAQSHRIEEGFTKKGGRNPNPPVATPNFIPPAQKPPAHKRKLKR